MVSVVAEKRHLENGDFSSTRGLPEYKRRKISGIREFPPGCRPNPAPINLLKKEVEDGGKKIRVNSKKAESNGRKEGDLHLVEKKRFSEGAVESRSIKISVCSRSFTGISSFEEAKNVENGSKELPELPVDIESDGLSTKKPLLAQESKQTEEKSELICDILEKLSTYVGFESPSVLNNTRSLELQESGINIKSAMLDEQISLQVFSLPHYPIPSSVCKERKYPPRKIVSAVRDFPYECGRNMQLKSVTEDERMSLDVKNTKTHKEVLRNDENRSGRDLDVVLRNDTKGGDSEKSGDEIEGQFEAVKGTSLLGNMQEEVSEVKSGEHHEVDSKGVRGGDFSDEVKKVLFVYMRDKQKKSSVGISYENNQPLAESFYCLENEEDMLSVPGLMAPSDCPITKQRKRKKPDHATKDKPSFSPDKSKENTKDLGGLSEMIMHCVEETETNKISSVYVKDEPKKTSIGVSYEHDESLAESLDGFESGDDMLVVLGVMAPSDSPITKRKEVVHSSLSDRPITRQRKMVKSTPSDCPTAKRKKKVSSGCEDEGDSGENEPPLCHLVPEKCARFLDERDARKKVQEVLRSYNAIVRKLQQGAESKSKEQENTNKGINFRAFDILKESGKLINLGKKSVVGLVPGVEVGDIFHFRIELSIIGLHRLPRGDIDYVRQGTQIIAISIVASGCYAKDVGSSDVLVYAGEGGKGRGGNKPPEDQKLERGNLALKNSKDEKNFVRVIRGLKETKSKTKRAGKPKTNVSYTYVGLYTVDKCWHDINPHGKLVYMFELRRVPGQPELAWKELKRSKKFKAREGRCVLDISDSKETFAISAVNTIDDNKPPLFTYITDIMYPDWCQPLPPKGCDCKDGCSDSERCACAVKNGGENPYNHDGAIVEAKPLVYECGPSCRCPSTCYNRVSQHGIKFPLEIFKTESMGWGVRSLSAIPSGSFICEIIGELLDDKEAEQRTESDEYLFDIGQNYSDPVLWDGLSKLVPDLATSSTEAVENVGFTIDVGKFGNVGRFVNHSCTPNLYAQNVLYDHDDKRIPHIMLFASENIPPLQELNYHYNYAIDEVYDRDGNVKKKSCYCGSSECTGRMY